MKRILFAGICFISWGCATRPSPERTPSSSTSLAPAEMCRTLTKLEIHSHRGAWDRPENMMSAFLRAIDQGADYIEMDLQISADDEIIVAHDAYMKKECRDFLGNPIGNIFYRKMTTKQIKSFDCGSYVPKGATVRGERISTLAEVLAQLKDKRTTKGEPLKLNLEIKYNPAQPQNYPEREFYVSRVLDTLDRSGIQPNQVMIQSFDVGILKEVRKRRRDLRLSPLLSDVKNGVAIAQELRAELVTPHYGQVTPEMLKQFHAATAVHPQGIKVVPWTVNDPENARRLIEWGVDGLITDNPEWFQFAEGFCGP